MTIIDTGKHLPKSTHSDVLELKDKRKSLVLNPIFKQSRQDGTVLYGRHALNMIMGKGFHRETYDFDVYSKTPKEHAVEIEQSIDRGTNSNLAYVKQTHYMKGGKQMPLYRVKIRPYDSNEADFNKMPKGIKFIKKKGVRLETLGRAKKKYEGMIKRGETHRMPNAIFDLNDVNTNIIIRRRR